MAKDTSKATRFKVTLNPGNDPKAEHINKRDYVGDHATQADAVNAWKTLNGLDGIGVNNWPLVVEVVPSDEEEVTTLPATVVPLPIKEKKSATAVSATSPAATSTQ